MILVGSEFSREEYYPRIKWLMLGRVVLAAFLCGSLVLFQSRFHIYHFPAVYLLYFGSSVALLTVVYRYLFGRFANLPLLAYIQVSGDILLISWLVYLTGGIDSGFSLLYHVSIISASIILYRRGGFLSASLASILYGTMLDMQYYNVLGFSRRKACEEQSLSAFTGQVDSLDHLRETPRFNVAARRLRDAARRYKPRYSRIGARSTRRL